MLKEILKKNNKLLLLSAFLYSLPVIISGLRKRVALHIRGAFLKKCQFIIHGMNNKVIVGEMGRLRNCKIYISGNGNVLKIGGGHTIVKNSTFWLQGDNCVIDIGDDFTMEGGLISVTEAGKISIGRDCMFSFGMDIRNGDSHSIIDMSGNRLNQAKDITIKDHVWMGANVTVLKGAYIEEFSIIGTKSLVCGIHEKGNSIYAGVPAKLIKSGINWDRRLFD